MSVPPRLVLAEGDPLPGWLVLGEQPERETAFGAVGKFWQSNIEWRDAADFVGFAEPGWGKIAANFTVVPYGKDSKRRSKRNPRSFRGHRRSLQRSEVCS